VTFTGTPMECASLMMRNHADPGLIVAYLRLELERDPRIAMGPWQRLVHDFTAAFDGVGAAIEAIARALTFGHRRSDYALVPLAPLTREVRIPPDTG
jgi:hypothetical protein